MDLPIIFSNRSLTPPLVGWLLTVVSGGARGEHFPGLSMLWAWSELSVRVTADSSAVKSSHCELPPQEARQNEGEKVSARKECVTISFGSASSCRSQRVVLMVGRKLQERNVLKKTHLHFLIRKYEIFIVSRKCAATLLSLGNDTVVENL